MATGGDEVSEVNGWCPICNKDNCPYGWRQEYIPDICDEAKSPTVEAWNRDLRKNLEITSKPPNVKKSTFEDARKLFGANFETKVTLRTAEQVTAKEEISLIQFDPNFLSEDVVCCHASCNIKNPDAAKSGKRDLFLCPQHQQALQDSISEVFRREIDIRDIASTSAERQEPNCFSGYTSLISLLEAAYRDATNLPTSTNESKLKQEAILNVRNFLIITSTLLNPDESNLRFLPYVVGILNKILTSDSAEVFVYVLRKTVLTIFSAFGVIFSWVSFALQSPFAKIGAGMLGVVGGIAGFATGGPLIGAAGAGAGAYFGGLIGNGIQGLFDLSHGNRTGKRSTLTATPRYNKPLYKVDANAFGELFMSLK